MGFILKMFDDENDEDTDVLGNVSGRRGKERRGEEAENGVS